MKRWIPAAIAVACLLQAGCMLISQAQRDDEEEWHGTWGSEEPGAHGKQGPAKKGDQGEGRAGSEQAGVALAAPAAEAKPEPEPRPEPKPAPMPVRKPEPPPAHGRRPGSGDDTAGAPSKPRTLAPPPEVAPELSMPTVEEPPDPNAPELEEPPAPAAQPGAVSATATQSAPARPGTREPGGSRGEPPSPSSAAQPRAMETGPPGGRTGAHAGSDSANHPKSEPNIAIGLDGGILVQRGGRIEPGAGLCLGWNLGKLLGWSGLYLEADVDIFIGESPLGAEYVMLDSGLGFTGHFSLGPVNLLVGLEFVLRDMFITKQGAATTGSDPQLGFGAGVGLGLGIPLTDWLDLHLGADGRYARQPLTERFEFTAVISGGLGFSF